MIQLSQIPNKLEKKSFYTIKSEGLKIEINKLTKTTRKKKQRRKKEINKDLEKKIQDKNIKIKLIICSWLLRDFICI